VEIKLNLTSSEHKDLIAYCNLNDLLISSVVKDSFTTGFNIQKYGLLNSGIETKEKEIIKEVINYIEVPVVEEKEVVKIEYVEVEKIVEVPVEKIVTKVEYISDDSKTNELFGKIEQLEIEKEGLILNSQEKDKEIYELRHSLDELLDKPPVEKIVEVVVEKEIIEDSLKPKMEALQNTLSKVRQESLDKDEKIKELEKTIQQINKTQEKTQAIYFRGSNLNNKL
jgi:hypothetical protein